MIRVIFLFLTLAVLSYIGIKAAEKVTGKQLVLLTKITGYVIISSALAMSLMFILVMLF
jgi:hypothetical protein